MKKEFALVVSLMIMMQGFSQQDPQYNMYQFNQMIINPAYAGARDVLAVVALHRQQWAGFNGAPETTCLSLHGPVIKKNVGIGLTVLSDRMGPRSLTAVYGNFAYILKMNHQLKLSFGLNAGYNSYQFRFDNLEFKEGQLPPEMASTFNENTLDVNGGLYLRSSSFFVGLSASHLNSPGAYSYNAVSGQNNYSYKLLTHVFFTAGKSFVINENLVMAPTILLKNSSTSINLDVNLNFLLSQRLWLGAFYRQGYGMGGLIQFYFNSKLRAGLSYDSGLGDAMRLGPSYEAMIGFDFGGNKAKMVNMRFL